MGIIHQGRYSGPKLITIAPRTLVDNRIIHIESYVKPGILYHSKSLEEKGWKRSHSIEKNDWKISQTTYLSKKKEQERKKLFP
jgi:hypothetical protein